MYNSVQHTGLVNRQKGDRGRFACNDDDDDDDGDESG